MFDNPKRELARKLRICASLTIFLGGLGGLYYLYTVGFIRNPAYEYLNETMFSPVGFASGLGALWQVYVGWLVLRGLATLLEGQADLDAKVDASKTDG